MSYFKVLWLFKYTVVALIFFSHSVNAVELAWLKISESNNKNWSVNFSNNEQLSMELKSKQAIDNEKRIFVILPKKSNSYILAINKFLEKLGQSEISAHISVFNFDKKNQLGLNILALAKEQKIDLIFSIGSETALLVNKHFKGEAIPVVTAINKDPVLLGFVDDYTSPSNHNIAYTTLNIPLSVQLNYLKTLKPNLKAIGLIYNNTHNAVLQTEVLPMKKTFKKMGIEIIDIEVSSRETAKTELQQQFPSAIKQLQNIDTDLNDTLFWLTSSTAAFSEIATINQFAQNIPVIGSIPNIVKPGDNSAVLGIGIDRRNNALLASIYAIKILRKELNVEDLPVGVVSPPDIAINFRVAKKIGLKIPFDFFESSDFIYNYEGKTARAFGENIQ
ncbi:ABC transporter substrate-binding protein [Algibacillus agarilyticus]|uniref:ABC transporter substrate-binding protein n=1 Tax=Algibacillus agarilyticus TaxID=2234133 RepID=UPI0013004650|nr:ABC transporter substrate binding protein [Algibacillus agarilyticus]